MDIEIDTEIETDIEIEIEIEMIVAMTMIVAITSGDDGDDDDGAGLRSDLLTCRRKVYKICHRRSACLFLHSNLIMSNQCRCMGPW